MPDELIYDEASYLDPQSPFSKEYRDSSSSWALATPEELAAGLDWWQRMIDAGKAVDFIKAKEQLRAVIG